MVNELFYEKDGVFHVDFNKFVPDEEYYDAEDGVVDEVAIYNIISNEMADGQLVLAYDDNADDSESAFLFYKKGDNFFVDYLFMGEENVFRFKNDQLYWFTDYHRHMTLIEETDFLVALTNYIKGTVVPLEASFSVLQQRLVTNPTTFSPIGEEKAEKIKSISQILRSVGPIVGLLSALIVFLIKNTLLYALLGFGIGFLAYNLYLFVAIALKLRHAYCVVQLNAGHLMTPEEINWQLYPSIEKYLKPCANIVLSIGLILIGILL